jgi:hypothetical protein
VARLIWNSRDHELGVDRGVFYTLDGIAEAWNGLTAVVESPSDASEKVRHIDGLKVRSGRRPGEFAGTIEAYSYPESFYEDQLLAKRPSAFHFSYRTKTATGYKIHIVYNAVLKSTSKQYRQEKVEPFSYEFTTKPNHIPGAGPSAHLIIDTTIAYPGVVSIVEDRLYGFIHADPIFPSPQDVFDIFEENSILKVIDHGDGTFTVTGPDEAIQMLDPTTFEITWPSAMYIDSESYTIRSL